MKRYTSKFLKTVAVFYLSFPLSYLLVSALLFDIPGSAMIRILLSPWYYVLSGLAVVVGYSLWEVQRWGWYLFVLTNFLIAYQNAVFVNEYGTTHHKLLAFMASIFLLLVFVFRVAREIRVPYFFPKIRWWESNPRYKLSVPVEITREDGSVIDGQIMDISMGGCFIKLRTELDTHESVKLKYTVFDSSMDCHGVIAWRTQSTVTTPKGVGVKFCPLAKVQKRALRDTCHRLKKIAHFYRRSRYLLNQEEFLKRLTELESRLTSSSAGASSNSVISSKKRLMR